MVDPTLHKFQDKDYVTYVGVAVIPEYVAEQANIAGYVGVLDGRRDGAKTGVYHDNPSLWLDTGRAFKRGK